MEENKIVSIKDIVNSLKDDFKDIFGEGESFEMAEALIRDYLAGDVKRFNNAKKAEEKDRVKHTQEKDFYELEKDKKSI